MEVTQPFVPLPGVRCQSFKIIGIVPQEFSQQSHTDRRFQRRVGDGNEDSLQIGRLVRFKHTALSLAYRWDAGVSKSVLDPVCFVVSAHQHRDVLRGQRSLTQARLIRE